MREYNAKTKKYCCNEFITANNCHAIHTIYPLAEKAYFDIKWNSYREKIYYCPFCGKEIESDTAQQEQRIVTAGEVIYGY